MSDDRPRDIGNVRFFHRDHARPRTRRQFLAQGFLSGAAWLAGPSLLGLLRSSEARAQAVQCGLGGGSTRIPFLVFDLGGGASLAGSNVLVGTNNQLDSDFTVDGYQKMGLPSDRTPAFDPLFIDQTLGLAFHSESPLLRGILARATGASDRVNGAVFAARSDNDTQNNPLNPIYGIYASGAVGALLPLVGSNNSNSGGRSDIPMSMFDPSAKPSVVSSPNQARGLVDTGRLLTLLQDPADVEAVMRASEMISGDKVAQLPETTLVQSLINCAYQETTEIVGAFGNPASLDPTLDPEVTSVVSAAEINGVNDFRKTATIAKLVCDGFAGAGTIEFGGYDYHDGTRATGELKDERAGEAIGMALQIAANKNTPLAVYILSDGSVASDGAVDNTAAGDGKFVWRGDNSSTAASVMLVFHPTQRPQMTTVGNQVGQYRTSASVETSTSIGDNVTALTEAIVLNYLALHNDVGSFGSVLNSPSLGTSAGVLDPLTAFAPLPGF